MLAVVETMALALVDQPLVVMLTAHRKHTAAVE
jgi:hypothetical protein